MNRFEDQTDESLAAMSLGGDGAAFENLYERYFDKVYDHVLRRFSNSGDAMDVTQEAFMNILPGRERRPPEVSFRAWIYTIARRISIDRTRRSSRQEYMAMSESDEEDDSAFFKLLAGPIDQPEEVAKAEERAELVWTAMKGLSPDDQTLLDLHMRQQLAPSEIADVMGVSRGSVDTRLSRARDALGDTVGALMLVRNGRGECEDLHDVLLRYEVTDTLDIRARRAVVRHSNSCEVCGSNRERLTAPAELLGGFVPILPALALRDQAFASLTNAFGASQALPTVGVEASTTTAAKSLALTAKGVALWGTAAAVSVAVSVAAFVAFGPSNASDPVEIPSAVVQPLAQAPAVVANVETATSIPSTATPVPTQVSIPVAVVTSIPTIAPTPQIPTLVPTIAPAPIPVPVVTIPEPVVQSYFIEIGDTIHPDAPGAGSIENPGDKDMYTFDAIAGQTVAIETFAVSSSAECESGLRWSLLGPNGSRLIEKVFGGERCETEPQTVQLSAAGSYNIEVEGIDQKAGEYSLRLNNVPVTQMFTIEIGDQVSLNSPSQGAGTITLPEEVDVYSFEGNAGQQVFFDEQVQRVQGCESDIVWTLVSPEGSELFTDSLDGVECGEDVGKVTIESTGTHLLKVELPSKSAGEYQFKLWAVGNPETYAIDIGSSVSVDVPRTGAGLIESPGSSDIYKFEALSGQHVALRTTASEGELCLGGISLTLRHPDGTILSSENTDSATCESFFKEDITLNDEGEYRIEVTSDSDAIGEYSLTLENVSVEERFSIDIGEAVSENQPAEGAAQINLPGERDVYRFRGTDGKAINLISSSGIFPPCNEGFIWKLVAPGGEVVFETELASSLCGEQIGSIRLDRSGTYTLSVWAKGETLGSYSFVLSHTTIFP